MFQDDPTPAATKEEEGLNEVLSENIAGQSPK